ncbi:MAG: LamG domain-containing protein [Sedimentisphaerales bacterium]|nr:LamG domain-containing protein [Sedimentisphaerales bacterium]
MGYNSNADIYGSFWDKQSSNQNVGVGHNYNGITEVYGKLTVEMMQKTTFTQIHFEWDFIGERTYGLKGIWYIPSGIASYPILFWQMNIAGDYDFNMIDFNIFTQSWLTYYGHPEYNTLCDLDNNHIVANDDVYIFIENWLKYNKKPRPVAYWTFDYNADDSAGRSHGTLMNGAVIVDDPIQVKVGAGALLLDGLDDYVKVTTDYDLDFTTITMAAWVKLKSDPDPAGLMFILNRQMTQSGTYTLFLNNSRWGSRVRLDGSESNDVIVYSDSLATTDWTHVAASFNGCILQLYINGLPQIEAAVGVGVMDPDNPGILTIGSHTDGSWYFEGYIDDVRIYNEALGGEGIAAIVQDL